MGRVKQLMFDEENNNDLTDFLKQLIDNEKITGTAYGIAKQVIDKGVNSMSKKQKSVIDKLVEKYENSYKCDMCLNGNVSSLTDYLYIAENGLCPMCEYDREKFMRD
ncbi:hypothetical protein [Ornithobacterium rhinotracheale]|uniref:hypothetical protein n=1 Tax=Ornithobacterium rhinotracheale TaxID=28251 RepID=UPI0040365776